MWIIAAAGLAGGARANTVTDEQLWQTVTLSTSVSGPLQASVQAQNRMTNHAQTRSALLLRGIVGYALPNRWVLTAAYAHTDMPLEPNSRRGEDSLYEQVQFAPAKLGGGVLATRFRMEQRWRDGRARTGWRARVEARWLKPLAKRPGAVSLLLAEEPVVELKRTDFGQTAGDLQFRTTAGVSIPINSRMRIEPSYLNVYGHRQRRDDLFYNIAQVSVNVRL